MINDYVYRLFHNDETGHDYYHMKRVAQMAKSISLDENSDPFICEVAGWMHDVGDKKLFSAPEEAMNAMTTFLNNIHIKNNDIKHIKVAMRDVSFSKGNKTPETLEGKIVQDADRLDALGAIGIARTFAYGGANNQLIHHPEKKEGTSIQHFYDKLLLLKNSMNTDTGKKLAKQRHNFLMNFLEQFYKEWE